MTGKNENGDGPRESHGILSANPAGYQQRGPGQEYLQLLGGLLTDAVWVAKTAKNSFYKLFKAAVERPQKITHRGGQNLVMMSETTYQELLAGWKVAKEPRSLADRFRAAKITQAIARPEKFQQRRPRALDIVGEIDGSHGIRKPRKAPGTKETMRG